MTAPLNAVEDNRVAPSTQGHKWVISTVGQACVIRNDLRYPLSKEIRAGMQGTYPYYGPTGVLGRLNEYRLDGRFALIGEDGDHFLKYRERPMTLFVSGKLNVNNHAHVIADSSICLAKWFYYCFLHKNLFRTLTRQGAGRYKLTRAALEKQPISLPPIEDQRRFVSNLDQLERYADGLLRLEKVKRTFKLGLMQQLLTGQRRFPELIKSTKRHPGEFGTVPSDWDVVYIADIAKEVKTRGAVDGAVVYSCTKHKGLVPSLEYFGKQIFSRNLDGYKRLNPGDFAYATNHIEEGSIGLLRYGQPVGLVSPMYTVFRPNNQANPEFLFALLKTESYRRVFQKRTSASVDRRGSLRWHEFSRIRIGLPSIEEQIRIAATLKIMDEELDLLFRLQQLVESQKRGLLSQLLSGDLVIPMSAS